MPTQVRLKRCSKCGGEYPLENYYKSKKSKKSKKGWSSQCRECNRDLTLQRKYGITGADFRRMHEEQSGCCLFCGKPAGDRLSVDHDHDTGRVRGLVHSTCNVLLGRVEILMNRDGLDLEDILERVRRYLLPQE